jgi:hypothetical protein
MKDKILEMKTKDNERKDDQWKEVQIIIDITLGSSDKISTIEPSSSSNFLS